MENKELSVCTAHAYPRFYEAVHRLTSGSYLQRGTLQILCRVTVLKEIVTETKRYLVGTRGNMSHWKERREYKVTIDRVTKDVISFQLTDNSRKIYCPLTH